MNNQTRQLHWWKAIASFLLVLFTMPLGHSLMMLMDHFMEPVTLHYAAFAMGFAGLMMVIIGVFVKGDTKQTLWGFFGDLLFWTGWVEFLFQYYATRFGVQAEVDPVTKEVVTRPEYLIMSASFGFWMMAMTLYIFSTRTGCNFINWWQRVLFRSKKPVIVARPMTRHTSIVAFMEVTTMLWTCYLVLMTCYDDHLIGSDSLITVIVGMVGLIGSVFMFARLLRYPSWGISLRFGFATVIVFWIFVEVCKHTHILVKIYKNPTGHTAEIVIIALSILFGVIPAIFKKRRK